MLALVGRGRTNDRQVGQRGISDNVESDGLRSLGGHAIQINLLTVRGVRQQSLARRSDAFVLQQNDSASLGSSTLGYKAFVACDHCGLGIIHIGLLEETELELLQQNAARSLPD